MPDTVKSFRVMDTAGVVHTIRADWAFNNDGLPVFRTGERGDTEVVANFAPGTWMSFIRVDASESEGA
jgi:hypothetical protein